MTQHSYFCPAEELKNPTRKGEDRAKIRTDVHATLEFSIYDYIQNIDRIKISHAAHMHTNEHKRCIKIIYI